MNNRSFKNKNALVIVFEVLVIAISIGGITYAVSKIVSDRTTTLLTTSEYNVDYVGNSNVNGTGLEPISDKQINYDTKDGVVRLEFSLKGVSTNKSENIIYDIMLSDMNIDCSLLNEYTKWNLYKNGKLLSNGSLDPKFDGNVLQDNMRLTNIQEDLPTYTDEYDKYVLIFWISESCEDLETCKLIDQSNIINSSMSMKVFVALYSGAKKKFERVPNYDTSCANKPELYDKMIPVYYDNGEWKIANVDNSSLNNSWYNYSESRWANAVVVDTDKYSSKKEGTIVASADILGNYVWIPRYKYKTWNVENIITDSYNAYSKGIDIVFENGITTSGVKCTSDVCNLKNNEYLTHPAFSDNLRGFWVSKYEINKLNKFVNSNEIKINDTLNNYKNIINNLSKTYMIDNKANSQIVSNLEWGSILYLSHSKYGTCKNDSCLEVERNITFNSGNNKMDTTTLNEYGVYDMAGSASEYTIGDKGYGSATREVNVSSQESWYSTPSLDENYDYLIRGGKKNGLYYYGYSNIGFDKTARSVLISK